MDVSPILNPLGEPVFTSHGPSAWKVIEHRGFLVSLEWTKLTSARMLSRCMVIKRPRLGYAQILGGDSGGGWTIVENAVQHFLHSREDGTDEAGFIRHRATGGLTTYARQQAREALPILGYDRNDKAALSGLLDCVERFGPDLYGGRGGMPRFPPQQEAKRLSGAPMWEVTAINKATGKVMTEAEV